MSGSSHPSHLCHFTVTRLFLASLVGHDLVSKPISLRSEEVLIVTGFVISGYDYPMTSRVRPDLMPMVSTTGSASLTAKPGRNRFRLCRPSPPNQPSTSPGASARLLSQLGSLIGRHFCRTYSFNNNLFRMVFRDWVLDPSCVDK